MGKVSNNKKQNADKKVKDIEKDLQLPESSEEELSGEEESAENSDESDEESEGLEGFSSDSDEEDEDLDDKETKQHATKKTTPTEKHIQASGHTVTKKKAASAASNPAKSKRGVIYIGRIPHGFYEAEMKKYFTQFGDITRLRLSRNKKTGKSKHYGFIEFAHHNVAKVAAETMNNYLLFGHLLKVHLVEDPNIHEDLFQGANMKYKVIPWKKIGQNKNDAARSKEKWDKLSQKWSKKRALKQKQLSDKGIDFDLSNI
ncbi:uncharacterized protein AC631_01312 [Debaryomyces fabryi]|uniref:RRM domain-containing protein n=1 Tax=Debaryomyces fabryi TaxID=58627 RepID=A0A0V1Q3A1_9ASCO|nr:uncharacterized protein AC631_01312 [Debaryomyces fabryi]KSA02947.1 hypothetical protein AC631_01312 [Debaryomyces fabryi]CUM50910.1 unnamed protein product [Debaryomyces fabryi]